MKIKRRVTEKEYIHQLLDYKTKEQLKQICRDYTIKGFSKYGKTELVDFVLTSLTDDQLEKVFEMDVNLIYTESHKPSLDWNLENICDIIKTVYPRTGWYRSHRYHVPTDTEKKDFKNVDVKGIMEEKRLDFTISFITKLKQGSIFYTDDSIIETEFTLTLNKIDFIYFQEVNQEGDILHKIYEINFGDFPRYSALNNAKDWIILADAYMNLEEGYIYRAIQLYEMLLREFKLSSESKVDISNKLEKAKKSIKMF